MTDTGEKQTLTDGERAMIVELFGQLRKAGCVKLVCEDILKFMDKMQLDQARERCKDTSATPLFADFELSLQEIDKVGLFGARNSSHETHMTTVEECMSKLLDMEYLSLSANDVSTAITDVDSYTIEKKCDSRPELALKAKMLRLLLRRFRRKRHLMAMAQAGLICFTTPLTKEFSDKIPRMITLVTAPNDRMEYEADFNENILMRKRVRSTNDAIERGPRIPFWSERPNEPYPQRPYFEPPTLSTGTDDCVFTHGERQTLIMSIIQSPNRGCTEIDDGTAFPSNCGASIDLNELVGEEMCELFFPIHHPESIEILQLTWGMDVPARLGIADTPERARRKGQRVGQKLPPLRASVILHADQPLDQVHDYFGSHLAWYFAWMGFYTDALAVPSMVGLVVWAASLRYSQDELPTHALYSIFISIWATLYLALWTRRQAHQAYEWDVSKKGTRGTADMSEQFIKKMRSQYLSTDDSTATKSLNNLQKVLKGVDLDTIREDMVHYGLWYFPEQSRSRRQMLTGCVTFFCCVLVMSISQVLFILEDYSEDLGVSTQTVYTIKGITAGMLIPSLKFSYHKLAKELAAWETWTTAEEEADSIATKEFVFGYFNSYISLLWIAFFRSDDKYRATDDMTSEQLRMQQLKTELFTVMVTAQFLNLAKEVVLPWLQNKRRAVSGRMTTEQHTQAMNLVLEETARQMNCKRNHSNTDEYLKMVHIHSFATTATMYTTLLHL